MPRALIGMCLRGLQHDPAHGADDVHPDRDQRLSEAGDLGARERGAVGAELEFLEQDVGRGRERDAQLVGPEAGTTGAAERQRMVQLFQPIFAIPARTVDVGVDPVGCLSQVEASNDRTEKIYSLDFGRPDRC